MEIVKERAGKFLDVSISGRLDHHWSGPFDEAISEMIREGAHHLRLDLTAVTYLSSASIGVLMKAYQETTALHGSLRIVAASERVRTVLSLVALEPILFAPSPGDDTTSLRRGEIAQQFDTATASWHWHPLGNGPSDWTALGDPTTLATRPYVAADVQSIKVGAELFAVGVGALGSNFEECRTLFGEFLAVAGTAAALPGDGTSTPDYMTGSGELVPEIQSIYAITFRGAPAHFLRFESMAADSAVPFSEIAAACSSLAGTSAFGVVVAAEVAGLVCAALRRSPANDEVARLDFPAVRQWLSFSPEREHTRTSAIAVGYVTSAPSAEIAPFVRRIGDGLAGHVHAAVTAFRPMSRRRVELTTLVEQAFQPRSLISVVHLLRDDRAIEGAGESEFHRGACWVFPLAATDGGGTT